MATCANKLEFVLIGSYMIWFYNSHQKITLSLKGNFQFVLRSLIYPMLVSVPRWNANQCYSLQIAYLLLETFPILFQVFFLFLQLRGCFSDWYQKVGSIKLRINNDDWHETFNLLRVSIYEMLHSEVSYMSQNKNVNKLLRVRNTDWISPLNKKKIFKAHY